MALRLGNLDEDNKYWLDECNRKCIFYGRGRDNLSHYVRECRETSSELSSVEERIKRLRDLSMEDKKRKVVVKL